MIPEYLANLLVWVMVPSAWIVLLSYIILRATS